MGVSKPVTAMATFVIFVLMAGIFESSVDGTSAVPLASLIKEPLKISAFNIQVFGVTKFGKDNIVNNLIRIIKRYDVILVQEIRDSTEEVIHALVVRLNKDLSASKRYQVVVSERLGRSNSKEQYAFIYRPDKVQVVKEYVFNDDRHGDVFEREPYVVVFRSSVTTLSEFAIIGCHVKPSDAISEINNLAMVYDDLLDRHNIKDVIFAGDFNADCSYVGVTKWNQVTFRSDERFVWLLGDEVDTTVAKSSCAYDRFVIAGEGMARAYVPGSASVFYFDHVFDLDHELAEDISDHYPIELGLMPKTDIGNPEINYACSSPLTPSNSCARWTSTDRLLVVVLSIMYILAYMPR